MYSLPKASPLPQGEAAFFSEAVAKPAIPGQRASSCGGPHPPQLAPATEPQLAWHAAHPPTAESDAPLPAAELSARTYNALHKGRITTIRQFCGLELSDLRWLRNFGEKAVAEVVAYRARLGVPMKPQA